MELYIFLKVLIYFCIGIMVSCFILYFFIPNLEEKYYYFLFTIVFFWPGLIPLFIIFKVSIYFFKKVESLKKSKTNTYVIYRNNIIR